MSVTSNHFVALPWFAATFSNFGSPFCVAGFWITSPNGVKASGSSFEARMRRLEVDVWSCGIADEGVFEAAEEVLEGVGKGHCELDCTWDGGGDGGPMMWGWHVKIGGNERCSGWAEAKRLQIPRRVESRRP